MPTRRGYRAKPKSDEPSAASKAGTAIKNFGEAVAKATYTAGKPVVDKVKPVIKGGLESYLKGTQNLADKIQPYMPKNTPQRRRGPRGGLRKRMDSK